MLTTEDPQTVHPESLGIEVKGAYIMSAIQTLAEFRRLGENALTALGVTSLEPHTFYPAELRRAIHAAIYDRFGTPGVFWVGLETPGYFIKPEERDSSAIAILVKPNAERLGQIGLSDGGTSLKAFVLSIAEALNMTIRESTRGRDFNAGWYVKAIEDQSHIRFELINNSTSNKDHEGFPRAIFHWALRQFTPEILDFVLTYIPTRSFEFYGHSSLIYDLAFSVMDEGKRHSALFAEERSNAREELFKRALEHAVHQEDRANKALSDLAKNHQQMIESIRYAALLQRQQLPRLYRWQNRVGELAVHWEPRDLVGGDMWWVDGLTESIDRIRLCLFDCTGHGVPGAMLSLVFTNALERTFANNQQADSLTAVWGMQAAIAQTFGESDHPANIDHGCDLVFLDIDRRQRELDVIFAGLGLMHWVVGESKVRVYQSPRGGISAHADCLRTIQQRKISYQQGDRILLVTDGITDQIGDKAPRRALGYRRQIQQFESTLHCAPSAAMEAFKTFFSIWQGDQQRRDDVTILIFDLI